MVATTTKQRSTLIKSGEPYFTGDIPIYLVGSHTLNPEYIYMCIKENLFSTTLQDAITKFGRTNIIQIHRDLPGSTTSKYRKLLAQKQNWLDNDFLASQVEFYIPLPEKLEAVKKSLAMTTA